MKKSELGNSEEKKFSKEKTSLQKVGEFLKEARQGRNLSIEDLSSSLRIGQEQLIALEAGDEKSLPEKVFIKAMVRRIAEKLNLDISFILEELNGRIIKSMEYKPVQKNNTSLKKNKLNPIIIVIIPGILGLITSLLTLKYFEQEQQQSIIEPQIHLNTLDIKLNMFS